MKELPGKIAGSASTQSAGYERNLSKKPAEHRYHCESKIKCRQTCRSVMKEAGLMSRTCETGIGAMQLRVVEVFQVQVVRPAFWPEQNYIDGSL